MADLNTLKIPKYYVPFVEPVVEQDLIQGLIVLGNEALDFYRSISESNSMYCYEEGKWSIKQVLAHVIDTERVFTYRALAFSRNDSNELPGFDQELYAHEANSDQRKWHKIIEEFANVRASTIDLFSSFSDDMLERTGVASSVEISVRALGYLILGHALHHQHVIQKKYLG